VLLKVHQFLSMCFLLEPFYDNRESRMRMQDKTKSTRSDLECANTVCTVVLTFSF
jgi:hypothetical protein